MTEAAFNITDIIGNFSEEKKKYIRCWDVDDYRKFSPGEKLVDLFLETAKPEDGDTVVDWGCGTGRAAKLLHDAGMDVTAVDFAYNCLDSDVKAELGEDFRFIERDITEPVSMPSKYGFCTDVMEHIPPEDVDKVLRNILNNSQHVFFQISTQKDHFGAHPEIARNGEREHLHLTVWNYSTWLKKFVEHGVIVNHSNDLGGAVIFYVTGFGTIDLDNLVGVVNIPKEKQLENMEANSKLGFPNLQPHQKTDIEVMILAGGPSLNDFEDEIYDKRMDGMPLITVNGTYNWAIERGLSPSLQMVIDGRPHNSRFTRQHELTKTTKYVIASQCDPSVFEGLPKDRTYIWQVSDAEAANKFYGKKFDDWWPIHGGSTVTTRALVALQLLGYSKFHVYGLDSCVREEEHHAYEQKENDPQMKRLLKVTLGAGTEFEKDFMVAPWMVNQFRDFEKMIGTVLKDCQMIVYGDGLIASYLRASAEADVKLEET